jgi:dienelactone hydrolase
MRNVVIHLVLVVGSSVLSAQEYGKADTGEPGDAMIQAHLRREAEALDASFSEDLRSLEAATRNRARLREEYLHMLGLWPLPERTSLQATVTGTVEGDGYVVERLHYQSKPRLYVTANLYRPAVVERGARLPAVLYACGHSGRGRDGNKTAFQSHGIWLARHGYVALLLDTLQLGEIAAIHHGTYREGRWWWLSRGYTSAGVECWNGVRGIDYLVGRPDVDPERIAVTGISGGGAATFWIAAADERVKVAVPVSGMADLASYVGNRVINGHCDCMFLHNTFRWPWTRIAALIAPRPLLFVNSDADSIFPMDANERIAARLERVYSLHGASDRVDTFVSIGGHDYRRDIRRGVYRFLDTWLEGDPREVEDSEVDLVTREGNRDRHPIAPESLRVFATDADLPRDELNTSIDRHFVPVGEPGLPPAGGFEAWKGRLAAELRRVSFGALPERVPPARVKQEVSPLLERIETEPGIVVGLHSLGPYSGTSRAVLIVLGDGEEAAVPEWLPVTPAKDVASFCVEPRGTGETRWTRKNPPNYVERSLVLLGRTADAERVRDVIAAARLIRERPEGKGGVTLAGHGAAGILAAYAALLEPDVAGVVLHEPPLTHMDAEAPVFLNVLRVCDIPDVLGMLAPRPVTVLGGGKTQAGLGRAAAIFEAAGAREAWKVEGKAAE